ncbi:hypothetical protein BDV10DRAFT_202890 [Aspergillus recurvatus]
MSAAISTTLTRGKFGLPLKPPVAPSSDGAGEVLQIGSSVTSFKPGDEIVTHLTVDQDEDELATFAHIAAGLGQGVHRTLRKYAFFHESSLVKMPRTLWFREAATLACSGLTAENALFGPGLASTRAREAEKALEGKYLLVRGSGGNPKLGEVAKSLIPNSREFDIVLDVGGHSTVLQSVKVVTTDGLVALTGLLGASDNAQIPSIVDGLIYLYMTRGFLLGMREQFKEMNAITEKGIKPVVDDRVFGFAEVKEVMSI